MSVCPSCPRFVSTEHLQKDRRDVQIRRRRPRFRCPLRGRAGDLFHPARLFAELGRQGFRGATVTGGLIGEGHDGVVHAVTLFDDAEQPVQVTAIARAEQIERLVETLSGKGVGVFYTRMPVTAGVI